jgi:hypothetical protein
MEWSTEFPNTEVASVVGQAESASRYTRAVPIDRLLRRRSINQTKRHIPCEEAG